MKKYFNFKGTITGNQYFLRPLIWSIPFLISLAITYCLGTVDGNSMLSALWLVIPTMILAGWVSISSTHKRIKAFWSERNHIIAAWIAVFVPYVGSGLSLYLWFADATYPNVTKDEE